jgi:hypothetical protein
MQEKPRLALILMQTDWNVCEDTLPVVEGVRQDRETMLNRLRRYFDILGPLVVDSPESLQTCQRALNDDSYDLILLAFQTRADDTYLVPLLEAIGQRPLILWCYMPWRRIPRPASHVDMVRGSGPVGALAALGTLRNLEIPFLYTFGAPDDPHLIEDLQVAGRAAQVRQSLRGARFGIIPSRNDHTQSTYVDERRLLVDFGPRVKYISVGEYAQAAAAVDPAALEAYLAALHKRLPVRQVSQATLERAGRAALALDWLAAQHGLDVLALKDDSRDLHAGLGLRPALYPYLDRPEQEIVGEDLAAEAPHSAIEPLFLPEGDLGAATAAYILHRLTGSPVMFQEIIFWDEVMNQLVLGHSGLQNPAFAEPGTAFISRDHEFCLRNAGGEGLTEGAQIQFLAHPGRVTLFQMRSTPRGWQAVAASGVCLEGLPWVEGCPHAMLRLDASLTHFFNRLAVVGATQHWVMAYGSVLHEIEAFCEMEDLPLEVLRL